MAAIKRESIHRSLSPPSQSRPLQEDKARLQDEKTVLQEEKTSLEQRTNTAHKRASDAEASLLAVQNELLASQKNREDRFVKIRCIRTSHASQTLVFRDDAVSWLPLDPFSVATRPS